ncbi:hypothetical protein A2334_05500 [Candidatus Roizmanbacteria bacterium RIFOXYB2_FULL_38_10]|uniref:Type II secretion system protein GspG C-terminal domain-containing protein n=1 Tax=Candidatus Roizmanbacteria bacterium RIFOXYD1_FULL_38_12 TaxID=1802093 RepID=A0A1F7L0J9_9BACT|nr:MAG: hypothetical protein A3K47_02620 [Candidatus Roizmanbacteria bacterium RIFOXYA2_FULL_38_14]OGK63662.1 MAG: hypothetical protein A3K27_02620 [Candidatus Roizmanbacteria bacterium RIFOXYA1_FULL_37_12]OGK65508.1 MAG: hypothetical protein A3K38_02620 [Candidatus Roizmanbacteria bacterium RIFOXYB1_FULL_40_23]OGK68292.1 MAG: hypothetical protein A2334_05500 [Candidatus Roizmanbacteria bacterium RIFOXYB2_FULL_38_10]OGK69913.1 MAG: hypothetical protein A3K21_02625 [Candidatus Roizmanbacteria ba
MINYLQNKEKRHGFSFIEILVVVTIIGIISTIGMVTYTEFLKKSRDAKRKGDLEQIRASLEMYKSKNDSYPLTSEVTFGGDICDDPPTCTSGIYYLRKVPNDPKTAQYTYYYESNGIDYTLGAYLEQSSTSSCGDCAIVGATSCNYCMGPYGQIVPP